MNYSRANNNAAKLDELTDTSDVDLITLRYAEELRAVGQALEEQRFNSIDLQVERDGYRIRAEVDQSKKGDSSFSAIVKQFLLRFASLMQTKRQPAARAIELRYGAEEIPKLIQEGAARRLDTHGYRTISVCLTFCARPERI